MSAEPGRQHAGDDGSARHTSSAGASLERGALAVRRFSDGYGLVFALIFITILVTAVTGDQGWGGVFTLVALAVTLLVTLRASGVSPRRLRIFTLFVTAATAAAIAVTAAGVGDGARWLTALISVVFVMIAPLAIVRRLRGHAAITMRTVMGALCIYLFIGLFFAVLYRGLSMIDATPFFAQLDDPSPVEFLYFSFVTLSTVGYGDVTAATDLGRMLAITEALLGQVYLVTIVALLVSNLGRERPAKRHSRHPSDQPNGGAEPASDAAGRPPNDPRAADEAWPDDGA